jgi:sulfur relay protein TusB/DsrH
MDSSIVERIASEDDVVFIESGVFCLLKKHRFALTIDKIDNAINLFALSEDLIIRGIAADEIHSRIKLIDHPELVKLTEKNSHIQSWY